MECFFSHIGLKHVKPLIRNIPVDKNAPWHHQYKSYVLFFKKINRQLTTQDLIIGMSLAYAWMPRILKLNSNNLNRSVRILNQAKNNKNRITLEQIEHLKDLIDNSLVGVSKLLHFVNPKKYAIWDSRVSLCLTGSERYKSKPEAYVHYLDMCERITSLKGYKTIHKSYLIKIGYRVSCMRSLEHLFYNNSNNPIKL